MVEKLLEKLQENKYVLWILILTITIIWGYAWVLMKESLHYMGPFAFSSFRFGIGAVTLLLMVFFLKVGFPPRESWKHLIVVGLLQTAIVFLLVMFALKFVDAGKTSVLLYSMPIWSSILAVKFLHEKITPAKLAGLLIGMLGLLAILGGDIWMGQDVHVIFGELLIIIAAISWGISNVYYRIHVQHLSKLQATAFQMLFGTIVIFFVTLFMEWGEPIQLNADSVYYILFTGILASALCFFVWFVIISVVDMVTATLSTLLVPLFGLLFSSFLLNETMSFSMMIGFMLIITGITVAQLKQPRRV
ncbi:DMT family transporter [Oceanobacillus polygoni]|uniref:DMT family transporter n=1 Tax=Oceanobacillus polygoni TaxID=1235259 RepID=UPI0011F377D2|nr:DMT family transporter [Oceanobacillus polygoni]